jgi:polyisoprenoid-binding protein YceI
MIIYSLCNAIKNNTAQKAFRCLITGLLISTTIAGNSLLAQKMYKVKPTGTTMAIKGTSNLHEWESAVQTINGDLIATIEATELKQVSKVSLTIPVSSIKSGKSIMDSKTYDALKNEKFPTITFNSTTITLTATNVITAVGQLSLAGVSKPETIKGIWSVSAAGLITIKGVFKMKMTDFDIKPPTAVLGTLKTGDEVEIDFQTSFNP